MERKTRIKTEQAKVLFDKLVKNNIHNLQCAIDDKSCYEIAFIKWVIVNGFELIDYDNYGYKLFRFEENIIC